MFCSTLAVSQDSLQTNAIRPESAPTKISCGGELIYYKRCPRVRCRYGGKGCREVELLTEVGERGLPSSPFQDGLNVL